MVKMPFLCKSYKFKDTFYQIYQSYVKNQDIFEELVQIALRLDQRKELEKIFFAHIIRLNTPLDGFFKQKSS